MRDRRIILAALAVFVTLVTVPSWFNLLAGTRVAALPLERPAGEAACLAPASVMRISHPQLLAEWREKVVRRGERTMVDEAGAVRAMSLTRTCLGCHDRKAEFCDRCHDRAGAQPTCMRCHVEPPRPGGAGR